jgi:hypothetical protein
MGLGCALKARQCHRLHCYISAPVLFAGAVAVALVGLGATPLSPHAVSYIIDGTLVLALLSFLSEAMFGKYLTRYPGRLASSSLALVACAATH